MKRLLGRSIIFYLRSRFRNIEFWSRHPQSTQSAVLERLLHASKDTEYGKTYRFDQISSPSDFQKQVPLTNYEALYPLIERMMYGERNVLWPGVINWFAKSSGTTNQKSKYLPVSREFLKESLIQGSWDTMALLYHYNDNPKVFESKTLILGGSLEPFKPYPATTIGDISAIMLTKMPLVSRPFYSPDVSTATLKDWNEKIEKTAKLTIGDPEICTLSGVPTWNIVLFKKMMEMANANNMSEIWPNFNTYIHGGVNFTPYRKQFQDFFPDREIIFQEVYNASEGYFASQSNPDDRDMLLLLDSGIFYEFIPMSEYGSENPKVLSLREVETGVNYALIITTTAGLFRYSIGDTVMFTSTDPYKIMITGRTKQFINAFGEEVMIHNTDEAIEHACSDTNSLLSDYTVAPVYLVDDQKGKHQWLIEFDKAPGDLNRFIESLDSKLKILNSDYEAKRFKNLALERPEIIVLPSGTFRNWLENTRIITAQTKIPRLSNDRKIADQILEFVSTSFE